MMPVESQRRCCTIREATESDAAEVLECLRTAFEPYRPHYSPEAFADTTLTPATLRSRCSMMCVLVATSEDGDVVGTVAYRAIDRADCHIRGMAVLPSWQGQGVAQLLLGAIESGSRGRKCTRITLDTTEPLRAAIRFYEKNGFRRSGKIGDFFGMPLIEYVRNLS